jgi:hypothetical protein
MLSTKSTEALGVTGGLFVGWDNAVCPPVRLGLLSTEPTGGTTCSLEDTWIELHALHRHGWSFAALAREFGVNWRTPSGTPPSTNRSAIGRTADRLS